MGKPHFFLSYVHDQGRDDESVREFFTDLHHDVQLRSGNRGEDVGFCDTTLRVGDRWSPALIEALATCTAFVAVCSPTYFRSEACGKEWWIFRQRLAGLRSTVGASPLVALKWIVPFELPDSAQDIHHRDAAFGEAYARLGLRDLIEIHEHQSGYRTLLNGLASRIAELAQNVTVPHYPERPGFDEVPTGFPIDGHPSARPTRHADANVDRPATASRPVLNPYERRSAHGMKDERR